VACSEQLNSMEMEARLMKEPTRSQLIDTIRGHRASLSASRCVAVTSRRACCPSCARRWRPRGDFRRRVVADSSAAEVTKARTAAQRKALLSAGPEEEDDYAVRQPPGAGAHADACGRNQIV
jgi:hypothetical protein